MRPRRAPRPLSEVHTAGPFDQRFGLLPEPSRILLPVHHASELRWTHASVTPEGRDEVRQRVEPGSMADLRHAERGLAEQIRRVVDPEPDQVAVGRDAITLLEDAREVEGDRDAARATAFMSRSASGSLRGRRGPARHAHERAGSGGCRRRRSGTGSDPPPRSKSTLGRVRRVLRIPAPSWLRAYCAGAPCPAEPAAPKMNRCRGEPAKTRDRAPIPMKTGCRDTARGHCRATARVPAPAARGDGGRDPDVRSGARCAILDGRGARSRRAEREVRAGAAAAGRSRTRPRSARRDGFGTARPRQLQERIARLDETLARISAMLPLYEVETTVSRSQ